MVTEIFESINSTNDYLKEKSKEGVLKPKDGVIAFSQTGGRGRLGRSFVSPYGGVYVSFCYDNVKAEDDSYLSIMPVSAAIISSFIKEKLNITTQIKWPNDVLYNGKKCTGILAERTMNGDLIIGVGVNYSIEKFDETIKDTAISLFAYQKDRANIKEFALSLLDALRTARPFVENSCMFDYYNSHLLYKGRVVTLKTIYNNELVEGECVGVNKQGAIILKNKSGEIKYYAVGELTTHFN